MLNPLVSRKFTNLTGSPTFIYLYDETSIALQAKNIVVVGLSIYWSTQDQAGKAVIQYSR